MIQSRAHLLKKKNNGPDYALYKARPLLFLKASDLELRPK